jgi:putative ABC transport system permease protein
MTPLRLAQTLVRAFSRLVPRWQRQDWRQEWDAELQHQALDRNEPFGTLSRSTGAAVDAVYLRSQALQLDVLARDLTFAWRNAIRRPAFTLLVVMTLALGIGVNSAVFALLDGVLLRPLPYRDPSRLVFVWHTLPSQNIFEVEATAWDYGDWRSLRSFSELALVSGGSVTIGGGDDPPERVRISSVTASLMPMLGIAPAIGRGFTPAEDTTDAPGVVILSDGLWRRRFGADPNVLGRVIQVNNEQLAIVGVMPRGAALPGPTGGDEELWASAHMSAANWANDRSHNFVILARLADGTSLSQASAELEVHAARVAAERPSHRNVGVRVIPITEQTVKSARPTLLVIAGGVALLLLVASANASTLLLARAANRQHELAVRTALGATRSHLLSLAMMDCLVLALLGGLVGLALGSWTLDAMIPLLGAAVPKSLAVAVDGRVALFTAAVTTVLGVLFGAIVAAHRPGHSLSAALKSTARTASVAAAGQTRRALVVAQVALAVVLLSAAGLMLNSVVKLSRVNAGFDPRQLLTFRLALTTQNYAAFPSRAAFGSDVLQRLAAIPGVRHAALISSIPLGGNRGANGVEIEGRPPNPSETIIIDQRHISPNYFQTMAIPMVSGRPFTATDDNRAEPVTIVNRAMAQRYWPDQNPIDRRVRVAAGYDSGVWFRIVGVVDNVRHISLSREAPMEMYRPFAQTAVGGFTLVIKADGEPSALGAGVRTAVKAVDPNLPVYDMRTMEERIAGSFAQTRGTMMLLLVTALLAAALSGVAIYGSIWYSVSQRVPEIGVRLALGASRASVFLDVLRRAVVLTGIGSVLGVVASLAAGRLIAGLLFETAATDPRTHAVVIAATMTLAVVAGFVPARRATRVDPITALRNE